MDCPKLEGHKYFDDRELVQSWYDSETRPNVKELLAEAVLYVEECICDSTDYQGADRFDDIDFGASYSSEDYEDDKAAIQAYLDDPLLAHGKGYSKALKAMRGALRSLDERVEQSEEGSAEEENEEEEPVEEEEEEDLDVEEEEEEGSSEPGSEADRPQHGYWQDVDTLQGYLDASDRPNVKQLLAEAIVEIEGDIYEDDYPDGDYPGNDRFEDFGATFEREDIDDDIAEIKGYMEELSSNGRKKPRNVLNRKVLYLKKLKRNS